MDDRKWTLSYTLKFKGDLPGVLTHYLCGIQSCLNAKLYQSLWTIHPSQAFALTRYEAEALYKKFRSQDNHFHANIVPVPWLNEEVAEDD